MTLILTLLIPLSWILVHHQTCAYGNDNGSFVDFPKSYPNVSEVGQDGVYYLGQSVTISWTTVLEEYNITLWQEDFVGNGAFPAGSPIFQKNVGDAEVNSYQWVIQTYGFSIDFSHTFFLGCGFSTPNTGFTSEYFNISSSSSASSSITATTSPTAMSSATTSSQAPQVTVEGTTNQSMSQGAKVGLGVGLGLGVPLLIVLGALLCLRIVRGKKVRQQYAASPGAQPPIYRFPPLNTQMAPVEAAQKQSSPVELEQPGVVYRG